MATIADNLQAIKARIERAARSVERDPSAVRLLAVSKGQPPSAIEQAHAAGQLAFGENYVQEALEKMDAFARSPLEWHLIGPLQSNKTRLVAERFQWVHTLERERIAQRLSAQRPRELPPLNVLLQVNVSGESTKSGMPAADVLPLARQVAPLARLKLRGLMAIPEPGAERSRYRQVKDLFDRMQQEFGADTLSMGMSDDMELAIAEGATMVRIGTAIFGERPRVKSAA